MIKVETFCCSHGGCEAKATSAVGYQSVLLLGWSVDDAGRKTPLLRCPSHSSLSEEERLVQVNGAKNILGILSAVGEGPLHIPRVEALVKEALFIISLHPVLSSRLGCVSDGASFRAQAEDEMCWKCKQIFGACSVVNCSHGRADRHCAVCGAPRDS